MSVSRLSKSRFQRGLQCGKALWLTVHNPELADPITERQQALFDDGHHVGILARDCFPGGVLVSEDHTQAVAALTRTRALLDEGVQVIYEPAFLHDEVFVRADMLIRNGLDWDLFEVKSSTEFKPEHVADTAVQAYVIEGTGLILNRTFIVHLDKSYVYEGGDYDLGRLFTTVDATTQVRGYLPTVSKSIADLREVLAGDCPEERIGKQCNRPYDCSYYGHCHEFLPSHPVTEIPRISEKGLCALLDDGIYCITDVPLGHRSLTALQREACEVVQGGEMRLVGDLAGTLGRLAYPVHCLDFETFKPALPLYAGTHVHQQIPFQWSDHVLSANGDLDHREFLFECIGDPRPEFVRTLVEAVDGSGSVVVYSSFENSVLNTLAADFPENADAIGAIQARLFDLEKEAVKQHVRHPDFHGKTSIKYVLPALVDDLSYEGLAIQNGDQAMLRYAAAAEGRLSEEEREDLFADLRGYCSTDTLGMVRLLQQFENLCSG